MSQGNLIIPPQTSSVRQLALVGSFGGPPVYPTYMLGPTFQAYLWAIDLIHDDAIDATAMALRAAFPSLAPYDALPWLAQDRQIFQGPNEPVTSYVSRLIQWLDLWRHAGSDTSVLLGMLSFLYPLTPQVAMVASQGDIQTKWSVYVAGSTPFPPGQQNPTPPAISIVAPQPNWDWDGSDPPYYYPWMRWRAWPIVYSPSGSPWAAPTTTWASGGSINVSYVSDATYGTKYQNLGFEGASSSTSFSWGDGKTCWGWAGTAAQASGLRQSAVTWKSGGTWIPWLAVVYDPSWLLPTGVFGTDMPDGTWGFYGKVVSDSTYGKRYAPARPAATTCTFIVGSNDGGSSQPLGLG